ncbi:MarR family winged helix-turn-helix transcriptional regulator [Phenylobacterium sp.]|uniref:MarR family winged helix-turn-helix transcriptional regulator n=1 Tax=Phenylobacterium sp. TaxID=1871053 RepID=UPI00272F2BC2|nr:MarR family transcriptional regulator [Phenylobacterium sp.]MDP1874461.1 MarR family transcriptional regulator [Phenylobacterium sp.]
MTKPKADLRSMDTEGEFGLDVPEYFFYLLFQAVRRRDAAFEKALAPLDLSLGQWRAISTVRRFGACAMSDLAAFTAVDRTTLTRSVDQLVRRDLMIRTTPATDRRQVHLTLTDQGQGVYDKAVDQLLVFNRDALAGVEGDRQREISRGLATVIRNLSPDSRVAEALIRFEPNLMRG